VPSGFQETLSVGEPIEVGRTIPGVETTSDAADWSAAVAGDGEAFGRIFDRHRARVRRHSARLVDTDADAEDVVAVTFFEAWRRRSAVRITDGSVLPWLLVTATNVSHNARRSARRYRAMLHQLPPARHAPDIAERFDGGEATLALRRLSLADRQVLVLCVLEGFSEREAAAALSIATGTVKSRLSRARARLADIYREDGNES
jgi:RNA polymerase sigma factor (sigma-70 family)